MPGARINDHEGTPLQVQGHVFRCFDAYKQVIGWPFKGASIESQFCIKVQYVGNFLSLVFIILLSALTHQVAVKNAPLKGVGHVLADRPQSLHGGVYASDHLACGI